MCLTCFFINIQFSISLLYGSMVPQEKHLLHVCFILPLFVSILNIRLFSHPRECIIHRLFERNYSFFPLFFQPLGPEPLYINCYLLYYVQC